MPLMQVIRGLAAGFGNGGSPSARLTTMADQVVVNFYQAMVLDGRGFTIRNGTISVPEVGDIVITDTDAEMCIDAAAGSTLMPMYCGITYGLAAATLFEAAGKSVGTASNSGTAFVPLPLKTDGSAAVTTARVQSAGAVQVAAELATTTRRHFQWSQPIAAGAWPTWYEWQPMAAPVLVGVQCFYVQIGADTTGPSYFASLDYLEMPTLLVNPS